MKNNTEDPDIHTAKAKLLMKNYYSHMLENIIGDYTDVMDSNDITTNNAKRDVLEFCKNCIDNEIIFNRMILTKWEDHVNNKNTE